MLEEALTMDENAGLNDQDLLLGSWIFQSQTMNELKDIIDDPDLLFDPSQSLNMPGEIIKSEPPKEQEEILVVNNENFNNAAIRDILPSNEDYAGPYSFEAFIDPHTTKSPWVYSSVLNKVFILLQNSFPVDFKWTQDSTKQFSVRAMPLFSLPQDVHKPVMRCFNHLHENDKTNKGLASHIWKHIIRVNSASALNVRYEGIKGQHLSVVVPLGQPQTGVDTVRHMYEFVCQNSCPSGMNRRPIEVVFTLEDETGHVYGRRSVNVRICSCPKRDKEKEEKEYTTKNGHSSLPPCKRRRVDTGEKKAVSFSESSQDMKEYELTIKIIGKQNIKTVMKFCHDLMAGDYVRRGSSDEVYKKLFKEYIQAMKNPPE